ncbi:phage tail tape measure protein [uncultured Ruminococcus sp.]|uniref:phage tail tape measure protein n=1 Tax=uncultured Ruminococcus sp. TaxID=165186 RepID=UPI0025E131B9|nr:phage tail tape measure protein [uncultured Ruminococcus sp.]
MASKKIKGITIQYEGDTTKLETALSSVEKKGRNARAEMSEVNKALKEAPDSVLLWQQKQKLLNDALDSSKDKLKLLEDAQEQVTEQFKKGDIGEEQYRAFERELEKARAETEKLGNEAEDAGKHVEELGSEAGKTSGDLDKMGDSAEQSSEGFTVLKGAVANLAAEGFEKLMSAAKDAWEEIDTGYDTIIKKTRATGTQLEELQSVADSVFTSMPVEMNDVGAAVGEINTRYAATGKELESLTEYFLKYAEVNDKDVSGSVRNVAGIMKAFQEDTKNTGKVLDTFTDVGQRTGKDLNNLESELLSNSATFKELGLDIRQSAELLGQFEANGIDTSTALAGLKKAQQEATAEGKAMTDALGDTINRIKDAKDETDALQIAADLFGKKGAAAMTQAIREQRFSLDDLKAGYDGLGDVVLTTFEATQDAPDKAKIALNELKLELSKLAEAVLPKVEKIVSKGIQDLPKIEKTVSNMIPLIKNVATAYASWKIATTAVKGAETIKGLATAMKGAESATALLNTTMLANPAVAVTAAIVGLTIALGAFYKAQKEQVTIADEVAKEYENEYEAIKKSHDEINSLKDDFNSRAADIVNESKRTEALWTELDKLADATGRVEDADKKRAEYILGELNEALGTEYTMTGNQIDGYKDLAAEIDNVIAKKKAEALLDQYLAMNSAMLRQNAEAQQRYETYSSQRRDALSDEEAARKAFRAAVPGDQNIEPEDYIDFYNRGGAGSTQEGYEAAVTYAEAKARVRENSNLMAEAKRDFDESLDYIHRLDDVERAFAEERYDDVKNILFLQKDANKQILDDTNSSLEEREKAFKDSLQKIYADLKLYSKNWRQAEADTIMKEMGETVKAGKLAGKSSNEIFTKEFTDGVQAMIDAGFDISELAEWGKDSGIDVGDVFGDNYDEVVQKQIDEGFDVTDLLMWGSESGKDVAAMWVKYFTKHAQEGLDNFFATNVNKVNELIGPLTYEDTTKRNNTAYGPQKLFATGGYIPLGDEGIVAEAGPELLRVMNGGIQVTPLSRTSTNTPVGAGDKTIINNYYNEVYATVASSYDVSKLAEDLAAEEKYIRQGKGE